MKLPRQENLRSCVERVSKSKPCVNADSNSGTMATSMEGGRSGQGCMACSSVPEKKELVISWSDLNGDEIMNSKSTFIVLFAVFAGLNLGLIGGQGNPESKRDVLKLNDVEVQTKKFISYYRSIKLSPAQENIKKRALSGIPAPCCANYPMSTCCCPCNFAKSVWGMSNFLVAMKGYDVGKLKEAVTAWIQYTHRKGFSGDACNKNRCDAAFHNDGCGGMKEGRIVF